MLYCEKRGGRRVLGEWRVDVWWSGWLPEHEARARAYGESGFYIVFPQPATSGVAPATSRARDHLNTLSN